MNDIASADTAAIVDGNVRINTSVFAENNAFADNAVGSDKAVRPDLRTFANYNAGFNGCGRINNGTVFDYGSGINPRLRLLRPLTWAACTKRRRKALKLLDFLDAKKRIYA